MTRKFRNELIPQILVKRSLFKNCSLIEKFAKLRTTNAMN